MKHLLLVAFATILSLGTFAQSNTFDNQSPCPLQIRAICIDETTCTHTVSSGWINLPAYTNTSITSILGVCTTPLVQGFEVRYAPSTGCTGGYVFTTNMGTPCNPHHLYYWPADAPVMPSCACSGGNPLHVHFDSNMNYFHAN